MKHFTASHLPFSFIGVIFMIACLGALTPLNGVVSLYYNGSTTTHIDYNSLDEAYDAVVSGQSTYSSFRMVLSRGTWTWGWHVVNNESVPIHESITGLIKPLIIESSYTGNQPSEEDIAQTIIDGENLRSALKIESGNNNATVNIIINGLTLLNGSGVRNGYISIAIRRLISSQPPGYYYYPYYLPISNPGAGIFISQFEDQNGNQNGGQALSCTVKNCTIINNHASDGAGIFAYKVNSLTIQNCNISNNSNTLYSSSFHRGHAIDALGCDLLIKDTEVSHNGGTDPYDNTYGVIYTDNYDERSSFTYEFSNVMVFKNYCWQKIISINSMAGSHCYMYNCNIVNNTASLITGVCLYGDNFAPYISNNIIYFNIVDEGQLADQLICGNGTLETNITYNDIQGMDNSNFENESGTNQDNDPLFVNPDQENYALRWDSTGKSPCIDAGNPNLDGDDFKWYQGDVDDQDSDHTRRDIGAIPLIDGHINDVHILQGSTNPNIASPVEYICFPGLVNYAQDQTHNTFEYMLQEFQNNNLFALPPDRVLNTIVWKYNDASGSKAPGDDISNLQVYSQYGYKIQLIPDADEKVIEYNGYIAGDSRNVGMPIAGLGNITEHFIKAPTTAEHDGIDIVCHLPYNVIYLGNYTNKSMAWYTAIEPIIDQVIYIRAADWAIDRMAVPSKNIPNYTTNWLGSFLEESTAINPGEMIEVKYIGTEDVEFKFGGDDPAVVEPYYREMPVHFEPHQQIEYIPMYLSIDMDNYEGDKPIEVAIFVDNECKGATVIKEGQVELNAYIANMPDAQLKNMEFRFYFPSKGNDATVDFKIRNFNTGIYENRPVTVTDCNPYLQISLGKDVNNIVPPVTALMGNYPNPFNPETRIKFDLATKGSVRLDVFNIKGQLVRTLLNSKEKAGSYTMLWNGKDDNDSYVSSGVYFYRLTTHGKCLTNKMLMLK